jgi:hypothetical protein
MTYTKEEVMERMQSAQWIRECCVKLLDLDARLVEDRAENLLAYMRDFFSGGWTSTVEKNAPLFIRQRVERQDEINRMACMNTFANTSVYLTKVMQKQLALEWDPCIRAFAMDVTENVYSVWINALCARKYDKVQSVGGGMMIAIPRSNWEKSYDEDDMMNKLETLYAKYVRLTPTYERGLVLVKLNGDKMVLD